MAFFLAGRPKPPPVPVWVATWGTKYHHHHRGIKHARVFDTAAEAVAAGYSPCGVCKPPT